MPQLTSSQQFDANNRIFSLGYQSSCGRIPSIIEPNHNSSIGRTKNRHVRPARQGFGGGGGNALFGVAGAAVGAALFADAFFWYISCDLGQASLVWFALTTYCKRKEYSWLLYSTLVHKIGSDVFEQLCLCCLPHSPDQFLPVLPARQLNKPFGGKSPNPLLLCKLYTPIQYPV